MKSFTTFLCRRTLLHRLALLSLLALLFIIPTAAHAQSEPEKDILDTASESGDFRVLIAYLKASGLDETLKGDGPFTIFAPSDSAFVKIPLPKIKELRDDPDGDLTDILLYHAVEGKVTAVDILDLIGTDLTSVNGFDLAVSEEDGVVMINDAAIVVADVEASNGVIHVLDSVLVPSAIEDAWKSAVISAAEDDTAEGDDPAEEMAEDDAEAATDEEEATDADGSDAEMAEGSDAAAEGEEVVEGDESADEMAEDDAEAATDEEEATDADGSDAEMAEGSDAAAEGEEVVEGDESADEMAEDDAEAATDEEEATDADGSDAEMAEGSDAAAEGEEVVEGDESADEMAEDDAEAATDEEATDADGSDAEMAEGSDAAAEGEEVAEGDESADEMAEDDAEAAADEEATDTDTSDEEMAEGEEATAGEEVADSAADSGAAVPQFDILDTANNAGTFTTLVAAIYTANLNEVLKDDGPFTLFAPADSAFATMPAGSTQELLDLPTDELSARLLLHVVPGELTASEIVQLVNSDIETADGELLPIRANESGLTIGNAVMVATNIQTSNGIIHIIDSMLDKSAFGDIASDAVQPVPMAESAAVAEPDAVAEPVAVPTAAPSTDASAAAPSPDSRGADLIDTAIAAGNFNTLVAAIKAANLDDTLRMGESFTIFSPTDEAFAALPEGTVDALLADPAGALTDILLYHIVEGLLPADYIVSIDGSSLSTVSGNLLSIEINDDGDVLIGGAKVVATNIGAMNGLIHVIDRVLIPPAPASAVPTPAAVPAATVAPAQPITPTVEAVQIVPTPPPSTAPSTAPSIDDAIEEVIQEVEREYSCLLNYVVDPGDTLLGIAFTYASTLSLLMDANGLSDPDDIKSGQTLCIVR